MACALVQNYLNIFGFNGAITRNDASSFPAPCLSAQARNMGKLTLDGGIWPFQVESYRKEVVSD